jgi:LDH2 family malate/lactate/ureidoglycolate dehydrogenase
MEEFADFRFRAPELGSFIVQLLTRAGADEASAAAVSRAVVDASARGFDTHGVRLLPHYMRTLKGGRINRNPKLGFTKPAPAIGHLDADNGFGHPASYRAIEEGMAMADATGIAAVTVRNSSHHGATGCYTIVAAQNGYTAIGMTNTDSIVVPHGGTKAFYGTNPISFAVPVVGEQPLLLDMATSSVPLNRVFLRRATGAPLPPEVAVDADGEMTTDAHAAQALLPLGGLMFGHKGAGLACMVDLLCSAFAGMGHGATLKPFGGPDFSTPCPLGHFFLILKPELFQPLDGFNDSVADFLKDLRSQPAHPGKRVMAPGDPEREAIADREVNGVPIDPVTWAALQELGGEFDLTAPVPVSQSFHEE